MKQDILLQGLMADDAVRFFAISGREMVAEAKRIHDASATCTAALGRTMMATAMMEAMEKGERDKISVIFKGDGPAGNIVCVGRKGPHGPLVKGYIANPHIELPPRPDGKLNVGGAVGHDGTLTVIRDIGLKEPYIGRSKLVSGEIAEDIGQYFMQSQQTPSLVSLGVHIDKNFEVAAAGGIILQLMPGCAEETIAALEQAAPALARLVTLLEEGGNLRDVISALLEKFRPVFLEEAHPACACDCDRERIEASLIALGREELEDMIEKDGGAELTCHFCLKKYRFNAAELRRLLIQASC